MQKNRISFQTKNNKVTANLIWNLPLKSFMSKQQTARVEDPETSSGITNFIYGNSRVADPGVQAALASSGMTLWDKRQTARGFTLIELLVVVLIIGILAAVALPQYQKAVWKSRISETLPILKALGNAEQVYQLANGEYTLDSTALDITIGTSGNNTSLQLLPNWTFKLYEIADHSIYAQSRVVSGMYVYYYLDKNTFHCCFVPSDEKAKQICSSFSAGIFSTCATDSSLSCYQIN